MYHKGDYQLHAAIRHTRSATAGRVVEERELSGEITGYAEMDLNTGEITTHAHPKSAERRKATRKGRRKKG
jgi:hypothetical protein